MTDPSPLMDHCPPGLPAAAYLSPARFAREGNLIWSREWVCAGRLSDLPPGTMRRVPVWGDISVILCHAPDGTLSAFHNACRHRGAELCGATDRPMGRLVTCPYHAWAYAASDGRLVSTGPARPTADFRVADHGLRPLAVRLWAGFVMVCLAEAPAPLAPDPGTDALANWPMETLVTGHRLTRDLACNWKVYWENYNECLHCPGIHPGLCARVPIYGRGVMSAAEAPDAPQGPVLADGAVTWTPDGTPCGPEFPDLTAEERAAGHTFVTLYPTMFVVAHVDHARAVRVIPTGPTTTRLVVEWLFPPATLAQPGFDAAAIATFAAQVLGEDAAAAEMNQRGLASPGFSRGTLMPEEFDIRRFHQWIAARIPEDIA